MIFSFDRVLSIAGENGLKQLLIITADTAITANAIGLYNFAVFNS